MRWTSRGPALDRDPPPGSGPLPRTNENQVRAGGNNMTKKEQHPGGVKLTAKTARTLAMQEFGTARGLTKSTSFVGVYFMEFGNLRIEICADTACIVVRVVLSHGTGSSAKYFDPDTLQENFKARRPRPPAYPRPPPYRCWRRWPQGCCFPRKPSRTYTIAGSAPPAGSPAQTASPRDAA